VPTKHHKSHKSTKKKNTTQVWVWKNFSKLCGDSCFYK